MGLRATRRVNFLRKINALPVLLKQFFQILSLTDEALTRTCACWAVCDLGVSRAQHLRVFAGHLLFGGIAFRFRSGGAFYFSIARDLLFGRDRRLAVPRLMHRYAGLLVERA